MRTWPDHHLLLQSSHYHILRVFHYQGRTPRGERYAHARGNHFKAFSRTFLIQCSSSYPWTDRTICGHLHPRCLMLGVAVAFRFQWTSLSPLSLSTTPHHCHLHIIAIAISFGICFPRSHNARAVPATFGDTYHFCRIAVATIPRYTTGSPSHHFSGGRPLRASSSEEATVPPRATTTHLKKRIYHTTYPALCCSVSSRCCHRLLPPLYVTASSARFLISHAYGGLSSAHYNTSTPVRPLIFRARRVWASHRLPTTCRSALTMTLNSPAYLSEYTFPVDLPRGSPLTWRHDTPASRISRLPTVDHTLPAFAS